MINRRLAALGTFLVLGTLTSCGPAPEVAADCLAVPSTAKISIVKVTELKADGTYGHTYQIDVPAHIAALLAAVRAHPSGECKTFSSGNNRLQEWSVAFEAYDSVPLILWIGRIGAAASIRKPTRGAF